MNEKFTPGPWKVTMLDNHMRLYMPADKTVSGDVACGYVGKANASLIAAAPEMYEALSALVENYGYCIDDEDMTLAKQSLAKARGEK